MTLCYHLPAEKKNHGVQADINDEFVGCLTVALCVHGKGQHQLGQGERFFKEVLFSQLHKQTWFAAHHWLSCNKLYSRALRLG